MADTHPASPSPSGSTALRLVAVLDATVAALAAAVALGLAIEVVRPGFSIHRQFMATSGSRALDGWIAGAFAARVLLPAPLLARFPRIARATAAMAGLPVIGLCALGAGRHAVALWAGQLRQVGAFPPLTLLALLAILPWTLCALRRPTPPRPRTSVLRRTVGLTAASVLLVLGHLLATGATDYRAPSDAILVLGSKVHPDGTPSGSLVDRTRTACALWKEGLAPILVLSGGCDGASAVSEPEAMQRIARREGVPDEAMILDETGVDTAASVRLMAGLARTRRFERVLVVSHDYHLARIRLLADRAGLAVRTVPAEEARPGGWKVAAVAREIAAFATAWTIR